MTDYRTPSPQINVTAKEPPLDWSNFEGPKRNVDWKPDDQDLIYTAINFRDDEWGDADEDAGQQIVERLLSSWKGAATSEQLTFEIAARLLKERDQLRERLQAIIDWADLAMKNRAEFDSHGVRNLDGPVFDAARQALASTPAPKPRTPMPEKLVAPIPDDSLKAMIGAVGGEIHNLSCERQNDEDLADRLRDFACRLWDLAKLTPAPETNVTMLLQSKADTIRTEYQLAYGRPCDCSTPEGALHYGRAQGLEIAADIISAEGSAK